MVGEASAHVQGESLKARAALDVRLINSTTASQSYARRRPSSVGNGFTNPSIT
jgi:hypothetical protein